MSTAVIPEPHAHAVEDSKFSRIQRWRAGETPGPWEMQVHPTNRCNLKCKICWERRAEKEIGMSIYDKTREISDERLLHLVDEAAALGVRKWTLVGGGEPMVRDTLVLDVCARLKHHGMEACLHTNATRFKREHFERFLDIGMDSFSISIDGPTRDLNDAIRGGGYDKAVANLRLLKEMKDAYGSHFPKVTMHPVLTNITFDRLDTLVELAHELGCEGIGTGYLTFEKPDEEGTVFLLSDDDRKRLPDLLLRAKERAETLGVANNFTTLMPNPYLYEENRAFLGKTTCGDGSMTDANCFEPFLSAVVHVNGHVGPCCVSYDESEQNIKDVSLAQAWYGPYMTDLRRRILTSDLPHYCAGCPTYITPRSEEIRYALKEQADRESTQTRWGGWGSMSLPAKTRLLAARLGANLRERGVGETFRRAWEWTRVPKG